MVCCHLIYGKIVPEPCIRDSIGHKVSDLIAGHCCSMNASIRYVHTEKKTVRPALAMRKRISYIVA